MGARESGKFVLSHIKPYYTVTISKVIWYWYGNGISVELNRPKNKYSYDKGYISDQ